MSSMEDVAREAKVALSTVSLALSHRERVKPETRERIQQAMRRLGYRPRKGDDKVLSSVPLRAGFVHTVESRNPGDPAMSSYCRDVISGMQESIAGSSSSLSIFRGVDHVDHDQTLNEQIDGGEFDGLILFGADPRNGYLKRLQRAGVPLVVMNQPTEHGKFSCVTLNYYGGAQMAIEHLLSLGHTRIAMANNDDPDKWLVRELSDGARDALEERGLSLVVDDCRWADRASQEHLESFCKNVIREKATAVFTTDRLAVQCADALAGMGVKVPDDISIIGFDDRGLMTGTGLPLTTIGYDKHRMGRMAIQMLQQLVQMKDKLQWLAAAIPTRLVNGKTTASISAPATQSTQKGQ